MTIALQLSSWKQEKILRLVRSCCKAMLAMQSSATIKEEDKRREKRNQDKEAQEKQDEEERMSSAPKRQKQEPVLAKEEKQRLLLKTQVTMMLHSCSLHSYRGQLSYVADNYYADQERLVSD